MVAGEVSVRRKSEWNLSPVCRMRGTWGLQSPKPAAGGDGRLSGTVVFFEWWFLGYEL